MSDGMSWLRSLGLCVGRVGVVIALGGAGVEAVWGQAGGELVREADAAAGPAAQAASAGAEEGKGDEGESLVELNFPPQTELRLLIDYVSQRLGVNIPCDEAVGGKAVTLQTPPPGSVACRCRR